jgi:arylsulfatase A-like enzyme
LISVDGLRPDAIEKTATPNIHAFMASGASTMQAQTILPSNTLPSHSSMLSGYNPTVHGITWDDVRPGAIAVPTVLSVAHRAGLRTVMIVGKQKLATLNAPGSVDAYVWRDCNDGDVGDSALIQASKGFDLMFVHFPEVDLRGHATGWMGPEYLNQLSRTDLEIGLLLSSLPSKTTVILTADHGGHGQGHGSNAAIDMTIPWIIAGPNVTPGLRLATRVRTVDTAATIAYVLGLTLPSDVIGTPVVEAFRSATALAFEGASSAWETPGPAQP